MNNIWVYRRQIATRWKEEALLGVIRGCWLFDGYYLAVKMAHIIGLRSNVPDSGFTRVVNEAVNGTVDAAGAVCITDNKPTRPWSETCLIS